MLLHEICEMAHSLGWKLIDHQEPQKMVSFKRESVRVNVYYSRMTVGICYNNNVAKASQIFKKKVSEKLLRKILSSHKEIVPPVTEQNVGWIDVKNQLPGIDRSEEVIDVLALCDGKVYELSYFPDSKKFYCDFPMKSYWDEWTYCVTHWMPLPPNPTS